MKDEVSVHDHLNKLNALLTNLLGIGVKINEVKQTTILHCSILDLWDNLIMSLSYVTKLDIDSIIASLLLEEIKKEAFRAVYFDFKISCISVKKQQGQIME